MMLRIKHFKNISRSSSAYVRQLSSNPLLLPDESLNAASSITHSSHCPTATQQQRQQQQQQQQQQRLLLQNSRSSIYRVPEKLRNTDSKAYEPQFISIGPYHHGSTMLKDSEKLKFLSLNRLIDLDKQRLLAAELQAIEKEARECYSDDVKLSKDEFVNMMLLDGCFIVDLFKELERNRFVSSNLSFLSKRWMLPVVRRDLITLENQLPMIVLERILDAIDTKSLGKTSLEELTIRFFDPLMPRKENLLQQSIESITSTKSDFQHLLDIFHSSITLGKEVKRGKEPHMHRSITELNDVGIKVRVLDNTQPMELKFGKGVLHIPSLQIDNHTSTFFRNILAYEQCHHECNPDMTTYLFFLDKLINSTQDVELLHYEGVIQHTLGSNKQVAKLVNNLCIEVEHDGNESYLCHVVESLNLYSDRWLIKVKARLKHDYFGNVWVGISTLAALLLIYLTLLQASCDAIQAQENEPQLKNKKGGWVRVNSFLLHPVERVKVMVGSALGFIFRGGFEPEDPTPC